MVSGFGVAASEAPIADSATAKVFNTSLVGPNLRQTAEEAKDDVVIRRGVGVEDPAGEVGYSFGGATPEASGLRENLRGGSGGCGQAAVRVSLSTFGRRIGYFYGAPVQCGTCPEKVERRSRRDPYRDCRWGTRRNSHRSRS